MTCVTAQAFVTSDASESGFLAYPFMHTKTALSTASLWFESMSSKIHRLVSLPSYKLLSWWSGARHRAQLAPHGEVVDKAINDVRRKQQMAEWGLLSVHHVKPLWVDDIAVDHGDIQEKEEESQPPSPGLAVDAVGLPHLVGAVDGPHVVVVWEWDTGWRRQLYFSHSAVTFPLSGHCTTSMWRVNIGDETHYFSVSPHTEMTCNPTVAVWNSPWMSCFTRAGSFSCSGYSFLLFRIVPTQETPTDSRCRDNGREVKLSTYTTWLFPFGRCGLHKSVTTRNTKPCSTVFATLPQ